MLIHHEIVRDLACWLAGVCRSHDAAANDDWNAVPWLSTMVSQFSPRGTHLLMGAEELRYILPL